MTIFKKVIKCAFCRCPLRSSLDIWDWEGKYAEYKVCKRCHDKLNDLIDKPEPAPPKQWCPTEHLQALPTKYQMAFAYGVEYSLFKNAGYEGVIDSFSSDEELQDQASEIFFKQHIDPYFVRQRALEIFKELEEYRMLHDKDHIKEVLDAKLLECAELQEKLERISKLEALK